MSALESSAAWDGRVAEIEADALPGRYYVTARDENGRTAYLLGPYRQTSPGKVAHLRALGRSRAARRYVLDRYPRSAFWTFGTARLPLYGAAPEGKLNEAIGK